MKNVISPTTITGGNLKFKQLINGMITEVTEEDLQGVTQIRDYAFYNQPLLSKVVLPSTVSIIGQNAFYNCMAIQLLKLEEGLVEIKFGGLTKTRITNLYIPTTLQTMGINTDIIIWNVHIKDLKSFTNINIGTKFVGTAHALYANLYLNNELVENLELTSDVNAIKKLIFAGFKIKTANLKNVNLIGESAFYQCIYLTRVTIGTNIGTIQASAFSSCTALTEIIIDKSCTVASDVPILANANAIPSTAYIYVPDTTTQNLYKSATNWSSIASRILVKES